MIPIGQMTGSYAGGFNINQMTASANTEIEHLNTKVIRLTTAKAETKRLVLAFESRIPQEITWALNTLTVFSCNSAQPFTLDNQPFLLESMQSYLIYAMKKTNYLSKSQLHVLTSF